jgi:hypothetical protein
VLGRRQREVSEALGADMTGLNSAEEEALWRELEAMELSAAPVAAASPVAAPLELPDVSHLPPPRLPVEVAQTPKVLAPLT